MLAKDAKHAAHEWVSANASNIPGSQGALLHGSILRIADGDTVDPSSDIDILVVIDEPDPGLKVGKFVYRDALLDVTQVPIEMLDSAEKVLGNYHLASSFFRPDIISDPAGHLSNLAHRVTRDFAKREWVIRRCDDARNNAEGKALSLDEAQPLHDQVTSWLFANGVLTHILLVAGLKNPTVRKRYVATRDLLRVLPTSSRPEKAPTVAPTPCRPAADDLTVFYEKLLELLGSAHMTRHRVEHHLDALADAFDAASNVNRTPVFFASDLSAVARPIAIDGSREMIANGDHREAMFWIVATWCRCMHVFHVDAPDLERDFQPAFFEVLTDLGITSFADLKRSTTQTDAFIPDVWDVAESIIAANPDIDRDTS